SFLPVALVLFPGHVATGVAHALFPGAPAGVHAVGHAHQVSLDLVDEPVLHLEHFCDVPGPGLYRTGRDGASVGRLEGARGSARMVEESEGKGQAALLVDGHKAAVADAVYEVDQARLELLHAAPLAGIAARRRRVGARLAGRRRGVGAAATVLEAVAVIGEGIFP